MINQENFLGDKPVSEEKEDKFQRYNFAKRIAETIVHRNNPDSIVIGLYGAWGEGKTSILNFIRQEIKPYYPNIVHFTFNPWRFTDEGALLASFFNTLALEIKSSLPDLGTKKKNSFGKKGKKFQDWFDEKKGPLNTPIEAIGEMIEEYGKIASFIPGVGEAVETMGRAISNKNIERLKSRIEELLRKHKKKVVIFIDDIDRLDKNEIHSIFRLVKLTGDFAYTSYILSFDENMVAAALAERFGEGNKTAGENFLEKIVQVPLRIPTAQPEALKDYCFSLVINAIQTGGISLNEDEQGRFGYRFSEHILPRLTTPRLAVRYANSLSFSISLLKNEVNHIDLLLIEAIKIFYPKHYEFINDNPDFFIGSYNDGFAYGSKENKSKQLKENLENLSENLSGIEKNAIKELLMELFPRMREAWSNYSLEDGAFNDWFRNKRITTPQHFKKYFSYAVIKGDISEVAFTEYLKNILSIDYELLSNKTKELIDQSSPFNFLMRIESYSEGLSWEINQKLAIAVGLCSDAFPQADNAFMFGSSKNQAVIFIHRLLKRNRQQSSSIEVAKNLMVMSKEFNFAYELNNSFRMGRTDEEKLFSIEQYIELAKLLTERAILEAGDIPFFEKFPEAARYLLGTWKERDENSQRKYIEQHLFNKPIKCIELIKAFIPTARSTDYTTPYKVDLSKERYDLLDRYADVELIFSLVTKHFQKEIEKEEVKFFGDLVPNQSDINILRQFVHWHLNKENNG